MILKVQKLFVEGDRCIKNDLIQLNLDNTNLINHDLDNNNDVSKRCWLY